MGLKINLKNSPEDRIYSVLKVPFENYINKYIKFTKFAA